MTAKQLEQETGCKIMVRGKGSMRDKKKVNQSLELRLWYKIINKFNASLYITTIFNYFTNIRVFRNSFP